ncbi:MAG TPA: glycerophosphodiester phosphodiesterase family protein [Elusimicrobiales bacterium]|nr:glycerophosphodiester phosphodiesterase family protein [Elusimicrobiales bacterium]
MIYFAHRGAAHYAPENTAPAFKKALQMGAKAVELDVHLSADGTVVVHHDYELDRTAGASVRIEEQIFEDLEKYNVAAHMPGWKGGERMLSLQEALKLLGPRTLVNVELKNDDGLYPALEPEVLHVCRRRLKKTLFSSFDHDTMKRLRLLEPEARLGVLVNGLDFEEAFRTAKAVGAESLHLSLRKLSPAVLARAHDAGLKVYVYTVDRVDAASLAKALGADGLFTNRPDLEQEMRDAEQLLKKSSGRKKNA